MLSCLKDYILGIYFSIFLEIPQENLSKDVVKEIYGEKIDPFSGDLVGKVVLSCRNKIVNQLNERILNLL